MRLKNANARRLMRFSRLWGDSRSSIIRVQDGSSESQYHNILILD